MRTLGLIPARLHSTRFEKKLIQTILNKPLLQYTYENAKKATLLDDVIILTDDKIIQALCTAFNAKCLMTSVNCLNGTERIQDALNTYPDLQKYDLIVNIQGDLPILNPNSIDLLVESHSKDPTFPISTLCCPIDEASANDPSCVKVVFDASGKSIYFSRSKIPYDGDQFFKHIGIYSYTPSFLKILETLKDTPLMQKENLEQLKIIENGYRIGITVVNDQPIGVDTKKDFEKVEKILWNQNISLSQEASSPHSEKV
ncbi:MAG: 3-deoxy-manno-octulosonate cytidylyltransferase [Chlamydiae bacterium]|nr:3-deoxy-manno-octulosonate cytidylyltransferase [Chlamydiota bacterium]